MGVGSACIFVQPENAVDFANFLTRVIAAPGDPVFDVIYTRLRHAVHPHLHDAAADQAELLATPSVGKPFTADHRDLA